MNANEVAVHEVDGRRMHMVIEGLTEGAAALGLELAEPGPVGMPGHFPRLPSPAYRWAAALLSVYRSRVDFLKQCEIDGGSDSLRALNPL